jgi:hypothetical protein
LIWAGMRTATLASALNLVGFAVGVVMLRDELP